MIRQAVVLVGGLGTRLGALTQAAPKPLLPVGDRPFLQWLVEDLQRQGISRILLLAGYRAEQLGALAAAYPSVEIVVEPEPLGTGGALRFAADRLDERFFFLNGDSLFDINLWDLALRAGSSEACLALRAVPDVSRFGPAWLEGDQIVKFAERPEVDGPGLINGGVGVLSRAVLKRLPAEGAVSIEREIYPHMATDGVLRGHVYDRPFIDIGVPEDFARAQSVVPAIYKRGAVIFDRDGVLNQDIGYAHRPDQIDWIPGALEAIKAVNDAGLFAFVATNQAGVARGLYDEARVVELHGWMNTVLRLHGAQIDAFAYSPYHPEGTVERYARASDCRKPNPGMIRELLAGHRVDGSRVVMIGDRQSDVSAAKAAGIEGILFTGGNLKAALSAHIAALTAPPV
jgi:D,D-heptose 1,7-bisphosphate phosphatase